MQIIGDFSVETHFFPAIKFSINPKFKKGSQPLEAEIESEFTVHDNREQAERLFVELRVKANGEKGSLPYSFDILCVCFMRTKLDTQDDATKEKALVLANKILYPAVRELVLMLSGRQPFGPFSIGIEDDAPPTTASMTQAEKKPAKRTPRKRPL